MSARTRTTIKMTLMTKENNSLSIDTDRSTPSPSPSSASPSPSPSPSTSDREIISSSSTPTSTSPPSTDYHNHHLNQSSVLSSTVTATTTITTLTLNSTPSPTEHGQDGQFTADFQPTGGGLSIRSFLNSTSKRFSSLTSRANSSRHLEAELVDHEHDLNTIGINQNHHHQRVHSPRFYQSLKSRWRQPSNPVENASSTNSRSLRNNNNLSTDFPCRTDDRPSPKSFQSLFPPSQPFLRQHHLSTLDQRSPQFIGQVADSLTPRPTVKALTPGTVTNNRFLSIVQEPAPHPFNMTTSSAILHPEIDQARSALVNTESLESISTRFGSAMVGNSSGRESNLIAGVFTRNQSQEPVQTHSYDSFRSSLKPATENIHFSHSSPHVHSSVAPLNQKNIQPNSARENNELLALLLPSPNLTDAFTQKNPKVHRHHLSSPPLLSSSLSSPNLQNLRQGKKRLSFKPGNLNLTSRRHSLGSKQHSRSVSHGEANSKSFLEEFSKRSSKQKLIKELLDHRNHSNLESRRSSISIVLKDTQDNIHTPEIFQDVWKKELEESESKWKDSKLIDHPFSSRNRHSKCVITRERDLDSKITESKLACGPDSSCSEDFLSEVWDSFKFEAEISLSEINDERSSTLIETVDSKRLNGRIQSLQSAHINRPAEKEELKLESNLNKAKQSKVIGLGLIDELDQTYPKPGSRFEDRDVQEVACLDKPSFGAPKLKKLSLLSERIFPDPPPNHRRKTSRPSISPTVLSHPGPGSGTVIKSLRSSIELIDLSIVDEFPSPPAKDKALGPSLNSFPLPPRQKPVLRIRTSGTSNRSSPTEQNNMQKFSTVSFSNRPRAKSGNAKSLAIPSPLNLSSLTYRQSNTTDHESISKVSKMMIKSPKLTSPREIAESAKSEGLKAKRPSLLIGPNKLKSPRFLGYNQSPCTSSTGVFETNRHFLSNPNSPYPSPTMAEGLSRREFLSQYQNQKTDQRLKVKNLSPPLPLKIRKVRTKNFIETADTDDDDDEDETSPIFLRGEGSSSKNYFSSTGTDFTTLTIPSPPKNEFDSSAKSSSLKLLLSSQEEAEDIRSSTANKFSEFGEGDFGRTSCADQHEIVSYGMAI